MADIQSDSKEESFFLSWETRTDLPLCDFPVFILKLSECKRVELSAALLASFVNYLSLHKYYCPFIFSIEFHFHHYYIVKAISHFFTAFITHCLFDLKRFNKLYVHYARRWSSVSLMMYYVVLVVDIMIHR